MFNHLFIHSRSSIDYIHRQLQILAKAISLVTQVLFIGYYVYLIFINFDIENRLGFLIVYSSLLVLSLITLIIEIYFLSKRNRTRLEKRMSIEKKRKTDNLLLTIRILLKIGAITLSGFELVKYSTTEMQIITFTLSIVLLVFYLGFNSLIFIINKDIDLIRLSIEYDIANSKLLTKLLKQERKEYSDQELQLINEIEARSQKLLESENAELQRRKNKNKNGQA